MYSIHTHTGESNASRGFPDSSIKIKDLVKRAREIGLSGIAITDHETVGSFIKAKNLERELDYPVICGNEIYLVTDSQYDALKYEYKKGMYYPHFILLAKDKIGAFQLIKLSTKAWVDNSFKAGGLTRTPTKFSDLEEVIGDDKGHIIATTACLGGSIPKMLLGIRDNPDRQETLEEGISNFIEMCQDIFLPENFYFEVQPATEYQQDQLYVNDKIKELSKQYNVPYIIATDAHYLKKELLGVHEKFLNSKESDDREVIDFYRTAYLMSVDEVKDYFSPYWTQEEIQLGIDNTIKIGESCERYNFDKKQVVPQIQFEEGWENKLNKELFPKDREYIQKTLYSQNHQDRYLMYKIQQGIYKFIPEDEYEPTFNRIEEELEEFYFISQKLEDVIGNYFITISKIIEIIWDKNGGDSLVGVGRGSGVASIVDYLLEVTEVNPIKMPVDMPFYRFMSRERAELPDIDFDTQANRRVKILNAVKRYFVDLGGDVVNCCTKGEYGSKSAIKTSAKGLDISNDEASVVASLVPVIRGFSLTIDQCYYGDEGKGLQPIPEFVKAMNKYEGWLETAKLIEGVYVNRGVHASGVFITNTPFTDFGAKMTSPKGIITSQWDLHESEQAGLLKYDFLTVSALDKIRLAIEYLIANGHIEKEDTLKDTYLKHFSTKILDYDYKEYWGKIHANEVFDLFQFDSMVAMDAVSKIKPTSLVELMQTNSLMRLQQQEGATETPVETYARFKSNTEAWEEEMDNWQIPKKERKFIREVLEVYKGVADTQEAMMSLVRNPNLSNFDITDAHFARKVVGKKDEKLLKPLRDKFYEKGRKNSVSEATLNYLWEVQIMRQASYAFSILHTLAYTFIALIELVIYSKYPSIYWNCACLSVNAEANDESEISDDEEDDIWEQNSEIENTEDVEEEDKKSGNTDYGKVASAIARMQTKGVHITLPDINKSYLSFYPNEKDNLIMFGLKGIIGVNDEMVHDIINNRPFKTLLDFHQRMTLKKKEVTESSGKLKQKSLVPSGKVITLIKSGAFDNIENKPRQQILTDYINLITPPKNKLIMSNLDAVINMGIVPDELSLQVRILRYKKFIADKKYAIEQSPSAKTKFWFNLKRDNESLSIMTETFFEENFISDMVEGSDYRYENDGTISILSGTSSCKFDKLVDEKTTPLKNWMNSPDCLDRYNQIIFQENWDKATDYSDNISKWEMDSVGFYYHEHELKHIDNEFYGIVNYFNLSDDPTIVGYNEWKGISFPKYEIVRICGTVVSRDKTKHTVTLLTPDGAVPVKYQSGQFSHYDKQISYLDSNGNKTTLENGWFKRGNKLIICGYRINGRFKPKRYRDTIYRNTTMLIEGVDQKTHKIQIKSERSRVD
jgi:DNA polymerase-3 subunit alpha